MIWSIILIASIIGLFMILLGFMFLDPMVIPVPPLTLSDTDDGPNESSLSSSHCEACGMGCVFCSSTTVLTQINEHLEYWFSESLYFLVSCFPFICLWIYYYSKYSSSRSSSRNRNHTTVAADSETDVVTYSRRYDYSFSSYLFLVILLSVFVLYYYYYRIGLSEN